MIRDSIPGGLRPSTLPLVTEAPHNIESLRVSGDVSLKLRGQSGARTRDVLLSKNAALTIAPHVKPPFAEQRGYRPTRGPYLGLL